MDLNLTESQALIRDAARSFAREKLAPKASLFDQREEIPASILKEMASLGLMGVNVPAEAGGAEAGVVAYALAVQEIAAACASTAVTMMVTNMVAEAICRAGTKEQIQRYVPKITSGEFVAASFALSEPESGSDAASLRATATPVEGGYLLDGAKQWITSGDRAGVILVTARLPKTGASSRAPDRADGSEFGSAHKADRRASQRVPEGTSRRSNAVDDPKAPRSATERSSRTGPNNSQGICTFLVPGGAKGLSPGKKEEKMGLRASSTVPLLLHRVFVPEEDRLGPEGEGFRVMMSSLDGGRIAVGAQALGIARSAFGAARDYAKQRKQFGSPIAKLQAIQNKFADMGTKLEAAELMVLRAASLKEAGKRVTREAAMAKLFATEASLFITNEALQIFGGYGYTREYPVERHLRDARVTTIYEGTSEVQRIVIAREVLRGLA